MAVEQDPSASRDDSTINRLVEAARECGEDDHYAGKRQWTRYRAGMPLDLTTDPSIPSATTAVVMENASGGGCSFWSKREHKQGTLVFVRQFSSEGDRDWLPAVVHHCTVGIRGFLIGVAFEGMPQQETTAYSTPSDASSSAHTADSAPLDPAGQQPVDPSASPQPSIVDGTAPTSIPNRSGLLRRLRSAGKKQ